MLAVAVTLLSFANYLFTLAPSVLGSDSGRFQSKAVVLGIGHPTGYPTYIMLGHLFALLPFGNPAYRVNLSSAVYAAVAVFLLYWIIRKLTGSAVAAAVAVLAFGVSKMFWSQAVIAEVYTMNAMFLATVTLTLLAWRESRNDKFLLLAAFLIGLSMTNHMTSALLVPSALVFVLLTNWRKVLNWKLDLACVVAGVVGLLPYIYLPIRASMHPPLNYGNPTTLHNFLYLVTGRQFSSDMWAFGPSELPGRVLMYLRLLHGQYHLVVLLIALVGFFALLRRDPGAAVYLILLGGTALFYALEYKIGDLGAYFIPSYLVIAIWLGMGLAFLLSLLPRLGNHRVQIPLAGLILLVPLVFTARYWHYWYPSVDQSDNYAKDHLIAAIEMAPPDAVFIEPYYEQAVNYMQYVEGKRRDIWVKKVSPDSVLPFVTRRVENDQRVYAWSRMYVNKLHGRFVYRREGELWRLLPVKR